MALPKSCTKDVNMVQFLKSVSELKNEKSPRNHLAIYETLNQYVLLLPYFILEKNFHHLMIKHYLDLKRLLTCYFNCSPCEGQSYVNHIYRFLFHFIVGWLQKFP